jgi:ATP-dependent RNA helicase RhlE
MFSATMPKQMSDLSRAYLTNPVRVEVAPPGKPVDKVTQTVHFVAKDAKQALLVSLLDTHRDERALVFARTKHGAERLMKHLDRTGFAAASIHGNKSQGQRDRALAAFRSGEVRVLVATDVAARGIDIPGVGYVYNYELPNVPESYVHRIGRTARAGAEGQAVALCGEEEMGELRAIEKILGQPVRPVGGTPWRRPANTTRHEAPRSRRRPARRRAA